MNYRDYTTDELLALQKDNAVAYYFDGTEELSDAEYDAVVEELESRGVSQDVVAGGYTPTIGVKVERTIPMLSLKKCHSVEEISQLASKLSGGMVIQPKADGLSMSLIYSKGELVQASTRGNGYVGEDVTDRFAYIDHGVFQKMLHPLDVELRGEVLFTKNTHEKLREMGYEKPRSAAAGALRKGDPRLLEQMVLVVWDVLDAGGNSIYDYASGSILTANGVVPFEFANRFAPSVVLEPGGLIPNPVDTLKDHFPELPYDTDGLVYKASSNADRLSLGETRHSPKWTLAYKFEDEVAQAEVRAVLWQVGRSKITPVVEFSPVQLGGSTVTRASLHNVSMLEANPLGVGDVVEVKLSNMIIPQIVRVVSSLSGRKVTYPEVPFKRVGRELVPVERNVQAELMVAIRELNVLGVGKGVVKDLIDAYSVDNFADLWLLTVEDILKLDGYQKKRAENIVSAIHSIRPSEAQTLASFAIPRVGLVTAQKILEKTSLVGLVGLLNFDIQECSRLVNSAVGVATAQEVRENVDKITSLYAAYKAAGIPFDSVAATEVNENSPVSGLRILITGTLPVGRKEAQKWVSDNGGTNASTVSKNVDIVVVGDGAPKVKVKKAEFIGARIIPADEFMSWFGK